MAGGTQQLELPAGLAADCADPVLPRSRFALPRFIVGEENALLPPVVATLLQSPASDSVPETCPERLFNPFTLVGPSGSGKSHFAQGLLRRWREQFTDDEAKDSYKYLAHFTAADFGREVQTATADGTLVEWRRELRRVRLLVIEDLQNLRPRATICQELAAAIDAVAGQGGQIVLTANREPAALSNLQPSNSQSSGLGSPLLDRLAAGLVVRLKSPGLEARRALLELAANQSRLNLAPEASDQALGDQTLERLAQQSSGKSPAQLLGLLSQLEFEQSQPQSQRNASQAAPIAAKLAQSTPSQSTPSETTLKQILGVVCRYFGVTQASLTSSSRRKSLVAARGMAVYLARRLTGFSYAEIGRTLGRRDHSTIMHAEQRFRSTLANDANQQQSAEELERILQST